MKNLINAINNMNLKQVIVDEYNAVVEIKGTDKQLSRLEGLCNQQDVCCDIDTMYEEKTLVIFF